MSLPIAIQLWSVRDAVEKDFADTLRKIAEMGYEGVEFAGYGGLTSRELKKILDELGLKVCGSHVAIGVLMDDLEEVIRYNLEIGNKYIICPFAQYESKEDFEAMAVKLNDIAKKCKEHGLIVGYHNHAHEFKEFDGEYGLDILLNNTDKELVKAEIDTYWVEYAGVDSVSYLAKHSGRCDLVHIKDMEIVDGQKRSTEVGSGILNIPAIVEAAEKQGAKWLVVEQEYFTKPSLESVKIGYNYLNKVTKGGN